MPRTGPLNSSLLYIASPTLVKPPLKDTERSQRDGLCCHSCAKEVPLVCLDRL